MADNFPHGPHATGLDYVSHTAHSHESEAAFLEALEASSMTGEEYGGPENSAYLFAGDYTREGDPLFSNPVERSGNKDHSYTTALTFYGLDSPQA